MVWALISPPRQYFKVRLCLNAATGVLEKQKGVEPYKIAVFYPVFPMRHFILFSATSYSFILYLIFILL